MQDGERMSSARAAQGAYQALEMQRPLTRDVHTLPAQPRAFELGLGGGQVELRHNRGLRDGGGGGTAALGPRVTATRRSAGQWRPVAGRSGLLPTLPPPATATPAAAPSTPMRSSARPPPDGARRRRRRNSLWAGSGAPRHMDRLRVEAHQQHFVQAWGGGGACAECGMA